MTRTETSELDDGQQPAPEPVVLLVTQELTQPIGRFESGLLVTGFLTLLFLELVVRLSDVGVPLIDDPVQAFESVVVLELRALRVELDVLARDDALEVARAQHLERVREDVRHLVPAGLVGKLLHRDRVAVASRHDRNLAGPPAAVLGSAEQLELDQAGVVRLVASHIERFTAVSGRGDVPRQVLSLVVDEDDADRHLVRAHRRAELGPDLLLELVEVNQADRLVACHADHLDAGPPLDVEVLSSPLPEPLGQLGNSVDLRVGDVQSAVLTTDLRLDERPLHRLTTSRQSRNEVEARALVERGDESQPEAPQLVGGLDTLADTGQGQVELGLGRAFTVVDHDDGPELQVDAQHDLVSTSVDGVLRSLDESERQRPVGVAELEKNFALVEVDRRRRGLVLVDGALVAGLAGAAATAHWPVLP